MVAGLLETVYVLRHAYGPVILASSRLVVAIAFASPCLNVQHGMAIVVPATTTIVVLKLVVATTILALAPAVVEAEGSL